MPRKKTIRRVCIASGIVLVLALIAGRIYLPYWLTDYVNTQIANLDGYGGSVDNIDVHLWRGAYSIHGLNIHKKQGGLKDPFIKASTIDLSIEWRALFKGAVVAKIDVNDIDFNLSKGQTGEGANWEELADSLVPFDINRLTVTGGQVNYLDPAAPAPIDLFVKDINVLVTNLRNVDDKTTPLPSDLAVSGTSIGQGKLAVTGHANVIKNTPDFDLDIKLENANLTALNDLTNSVAYIDFTGGRISLYSELAAANGQVTGYVKPILQQVALVDLKNQDSLLNAIWEGLVALFIHTFKNHSKDQFALNIPVSGKLESPTGDTWSGFVSIFRNAFGNAFPRGTDGKISFKDALQSNQDKPKEPAKPN